MIILLDFLQDKKNGFGKIVYGVYGHEWVYEGEWLNDDYNGKGKITYR